MPEVKTTPARSGCDHSELHPGSGLGVRKYEGFKNGTGAYFFRPLPVAERD